MVRTMPAGDFKARCLQVMEEVRKGRREVIITKRGVPVAKLVPVETTEPDIFDCMAGTVRMVGDVVAPAASADDWDALT